MQREAQATEAVRRAQLSLLDAQADLDYELFRLMKFSSNLSTLHENWYGDAVIGEEPNDPGGGFTQGDRLRPAINNLMARPRYIALQNAVDAAKTALADAQLRLKNIQSEKPEVSFEEQRMLDMQARPQEAKAHLNESKDTEQPAKKRRGAGPTT